MTTETAPASPGRLAVEVERGDGRLERDWVAVEEPLEIRVDGQPLAVTLRTPGEDRELVAGFLYSEGVVDRAEEIAEIEPPSAAEPAEERAAGERIFVRLADRAADARQRLRRAQRELLAVAACGACGKRRLEDLATTAAPIAPLEPSLELMRRLPARLAAAQRLFPDTGGLHAAALFDSQGELLAAREDIGRHNALDKLIGRQLLAGELPLTGHILLTSGRAGFEIASKAIRAGAPVLGAIGAASSLAIRLAAEAGVALYSFLGPERGNRHR